MKQKSRTNALPKSAAPTGQRGGASHTGTRLEVLHPQRQEGSEKIWYHATNPVTMYVDALVPDDELRAYAEPYRHKRLSWHAWTSAESNKYSPVYQKFILKRFKRGSKSIVLMHGINSVGLGRFSWYPVYLVIGVSGAGKTHYVATKKPSVDGDWAGRWTRNKWVLNPTKLVKILEQAVTDVNAALRISMIAHWLPDVLALQDAGKLNGFYIAGVEWVHASSDILRRTNALKVSDKLRAFAFTDSAHHMYKGRESIIFEEGVAEQMQREKALQAKRLCAARGIPYRMVVNDFNPTRDTPGWSTALNSVGDGIADGGRISLIAQRAFGTAKIPLITNPKSASILYWMAGAQLEQIAYVHRATGDWTWADSVRLFSTYRSQVIDVELFAEYCTYLITGPEQLTPWMLAHNSRTHRLYTPTKHEQVLIDCLLEVHGDERSAPELPLDVDARTKPGTPLRTDDTNLVLTRLYGVNILQWIGANVGRQVISAQKKRVISISPAVGLTIVELKKLTRKNVVVITHPNKPLYKKSEGSGWRTFKGLFTALNDEQSYLLRTGGFRHISTEAHIPKF